MDWLWLRTAGTSTALTVGGGHSTEILARIGQHGRLLALDKDPEAVAAGYQRLGGDPRFTIEHAGFEDLRDVVAPWLGEPRSVRRAAGSRSFLAAT